MAYIAPNSDVIILKGVPLDSDYNHTVKQVSLIAQYNSFLRYSEYVLDTHSYQRHGKGRIRVGILADNLYGCNYLMFRNTSFGDKWFYCFIDDVEYINDNASEIIYTIDVMQTWYFDYQIDDCFVEREHSSTDVIGDNIVEENLQIGDYYITQQKQVLSGLTLCGIVLNRPLPTSNMRVIIYNQGIDPDPALGHVTYPPLIKAYDTQDPLHPDTNVDEYSGYTTVNGVPFGGYIYLGIPLNPTEAELFYEMRNTYHIQPTSYTTEIGQETSSHNVGEYSMNIQMLLYLITKGLIPKENISDPSWSENNIIDVFQYPAELAKTGEHTYTVGTYVGENTYVDIPTGFKSPYDTQTFTPKNNKMFTAPYVKLCVTNNQGSTAELKFENFKRGETHNANFQCAGNTMYGVTMMMYPLKYKGLDKNYEESISISNFPHPAYEGDSYASWMQVNSGRITAGLISTVLSAAVGFGLTSMAAGPLTVDVPPISATGGSSLVPYGTVAPQVLPAQTMTRGLTMNEIQSANYGATSVSNNVIGLLGAIHDVKATPPTTHGQVENDILNIALLRKGFTIYVKTIRKEYAQIIDSFFTCYGYAVKRVKKPNLFASNSTLRPYWNYLKTLNCLIHAKPGKGLPQEAESTIASIFNKGITFWESLDIVGDYSLDNSLT